MVKSIIIEMLQKDKTHPTIKQLYKNIKEKYPNVGQATVYRNINKLLGNNFSKHLLRQLSVSPNSLNPFL